MREICFMGTPIQDAGASTTAILANSYRNLTLLVTVTLQLMRTELAATIEIQGRDAGKNALCAGRRCGNMIMSRKS